MTILSFVGKPSDLKKLSMYELIELKNLPYLNSTSKTLINLEIMKRLGTSKLPN